MTDKICLTLKEVSVLKEWFVLVVMYSQVEQRDSDLVEKLEAFEKQQLKK